MRNKATAVWCLVLTALLAACGTHPPAPAQQDPAPVQQAESPVVCRATPTGAPPDPAGLTRTAERGIGGTGAPATGMLADRGIGGTGIVAVITGFASVCLGGQEVALDSTAELLVGDKAARPDDLRAGQVAVVEAVGAPASLRARRIAVRHEVLGPVDRVDGDMLRIAGQPVAWTSSTWGDRPPPGAWVAVSGLRRADGVIEATRIDPAPHGAVTVRGIVVREQGVAHIGALELRLSWAMLVPDGYVTVIGRLEAGVLHVERIVPDLLASDPPALFGPGVGAILVEGFVAASGDRVRFGPGFSAVAPGIAAFASHRAVMTLERGPGGFRATGFGAASPGPGLTGPDGMQHRFEPAPMAGHGQRAGGMGPRPSESGRGGRPQPGLVPRGLDGAGPADMPMGRQGFTPRFR